MKDDVLIHYGRSIHDGAPGVGTGNWRRMLTPKEITSFRKKREKLSELEAKSAKEILTPGQKIGGVRRPNSNYFKTVTKRAKLEKKLEKKFGNDIKTLDKYYSKDAKLDVDDAYKMIQNEMATNLIKLGRSNETARMVAEISAYEDFAELYDLPMSLMDYRIKAYTDRVKELEDDVRKKKAIWSDFG